MPPKLKICGSRWELGAVDRAVAADIPGIKVFGCTAVGASDSIGLLMERLGMPVPGRKETPLADTVWPDLRPYQREGIARLVWQLRVEHGGILADDMGLGKTVQTLATWDQLGRPAPLCIVCPASVRLTWKKEVEKWLNIEPYLVDTGKAAEKAVGKPIVVVSYALADKLTGFSPNMLVLDEGHLIRGRTSKTPLFLTSFAKLAQYRLALTGTPQWSRPRDWWRLLAILFGYRFGTANDFDYTYCGAFVNEWGGKNNKGATNVEDLRKRVANVMLRRTKMEVAKDLPALQRVVRWVPEARAAKLAMEAYASGSLTLGQALGATLEAKLQPTVEAAMEAGQCLIFTWRREDVHSLVKMLKVEGMDARALTGEHTHAARDTIIADARATGASIVVTIDSLNVGVDGLQFLTTGIFHALDYVPNKMAQAEARLHRIGVQNNVTWVYMAMENSADRHVLDVIFEKLEQWSNTMGADLTSRMSSDLEQGMQAAEDAVLAKMKFDMQNE